jgi:class 3 adenylate cyclase
LLGPSIRDHRPATRFADRYGIIQFVSQGDDRELITATLRELGVSQQAIERAFERGDPEGAVLEAATLAAREQRTVTAEQVEADGGLSADEVADVVQAWGGARPAPDEPVLTPEEAEVFRELAALREVWPLELTQQLARMYGRLLARIARTGVQLLRLHTEPRVRATSEDRGAKLRAMHQAFERLLSLPDPLLAGVHRRWLEYELTQSEVSGVEGRAESDLPDAVEVTLLFCDLKDFTAYADAEGDAAAVEAIDAFAECVDRSRGESGRVLKALGDGQMLLYTGPAEAVEAGARIIAEMREHGALGVHASVHQGVAVAREGDYFGEAVNLAARLLNVADRDELVATPAVAEACGDRSRWESLGVRSFRGVSEPVEVLRLRDTDESTGSRRSSSSQREERPYPAAGGGGT